MTVIAKGQRTDVRAAVGVVVVFAIIGAAIFGVYYFLFERPAAEELEQEKLMALAEITSNLSDIGTDQASQAASEYKARVQDAGSKSDINAIFVEVASTAQLEQKRRELLDRTREATNGTYITTTDVQELSTLSQSLREEINKITSISKLEEYEPQIDSKATLTWRAYFIGSIGKMTENQIVMYRNSPVYGEYMSKEDALAYVRGQAWDVLRKLKFEDHSTIEVPVLDTFQRTPTIKPNSVVKIYIYDIETGEMRPLWGNATVTSVIYSKSDLGVIIWAMTEGDTTKSYSVNMWETIKAAAAGSTEAATVAWQNYGMDVMDQARSANIGDYEVSVIYVVEVPDAIGEEIVKCELHMSDTRDVILVAVV